MASKRRIRRRACQNKVRHATKQSAHIANKRTPERRPELGAVKRVYHCQFCGGYHVGHKAGTGTS